MDKINGIDEIKRLGMGEKFFLISNGQIKGYHYAGVNPIEEKIVLGIWDANYKICHCFTSTDFHTHNEFYKGVYDSKIVGELMIAQLNNRVAKIQNIYLKK